MPRSHCGSIALTADSATVPRPLPVWTFSTWTRLVIGLCGCALAGSRVEVAAAEDEKLVLRGHVAQVSVATGGGGLVEFRLVDNPLNPLNWEVTPDLESIPADRPRLRGHFLCLDRWGAPSKAEEANGVPFHGEAPRSVWTIVEKPQEGDGRVRAAMRCTLALAGLDVDRRLELASSAAVLTVTERVTNTNKLGRVFNMVQHPSIAPPFLDDTTVVDSNAEHGFLQDGPIPASRESASAWPWMEIQGQRADLRQFTGGRGDGHDVSSFVFGESTAWGWVTACNSRGRILLGYAWSTQDYPWLNIWRYRHGGRVAARGLEFGTTGYHQPYPTLVNQGRILDRPLYEFLDAGESRSKTYLAFLAPIPEDFAGVAAIEFREGALHLRERRTENARTVSVATGPLPWGT